MTQDRPLNLPEGIEVSQLDFMEFANFVGPMRLDDEIHRTIELVSSVSTYGEFGQTRDGKKIGNCIEPRPELGIDKKTDLVGRVVMKIAAQSPGGAPGEATDAVLSRLQDQIRSDFTISELLLLGLGHIKTEDKGIVHGAHWGVDHSDQHAQSIKCGCAYCDSYMDINREIANPTDPLTGALASNWAKMHGVRESQLESIRNVAVELDNKTPISGSAMVLQTERFYPDHNNVIATPGKSRSGVYVVNHLPRHGLDRNKFHDEGLPIQAYHDSLGASAKVFANEGKDAKSENDRLRMAARILRSASTIAVLKRHNPNIVVVEVGGVGPKRDDLSKGLIVQKFEQGVDY